MRRRRLLLIVAALVIVAIVGLVIGQRFFFPERAQRLDEARPMTVAEGLIAMGAFEGKAGHRVSGTVQLLHMTDGFVLRFEDYEQTQGPGVYLYLTPSDDPDTKDEVREGRRILIDGGADGGEITKVGNWNQRLPEDFDPSLYGGVGIWCERFGVPFGAAPLQKSE